MTSMGFFPSQSAAHYYMPDYRNGQSRANINSFSAPSSSSSISPSSASTSMSFRYYQPPVPVRAGTESADESSEEEDVKRRGSRRSSNASAQVKRGACTHCKGLKVKCHFVPGQTVCQRCVVNKLQCVVNGRKKRRAVATHEELLLKSHKQDIEIANLLRQLDEFTTEQRVEAFMSKAKVTHSPTQSPGSRRSIHSSHSSEMGRDVTSWSSGYGVDHYSSSPGSHFMDVSGNYYSPPPNETLSKDKKFTNQQLLSYFPDKSVTTRSNGPEIVMRGLIHPQDVRELFSLYFKFINPYFSILDPSFHTPERLFWRSHFLFTVVCTLGVKYSSQHAGLYTSLLEFARDAAGKALVQGNKTVDECQAFLLIAVYQAPKKRWEDQRGWLHMGIAFSLAQELKLNEPITPAAFANTAEGRGLDQETVERMCLNRIRTWLNCYCVDASHATQFGKPAMLAVEDFTARSCRGWYRLSPYNLSTDVHLVAYVEILRVMRHFRLEVEALEIDEKENPKRPKRVKEVLQIVDRYNSELLSLQKEWSNRFAIHPSRADWMYDYRADTNRMNGAFCRLVVLFYGLQRAATVKKGDEVTRISRDHILVRQCVETAEEVIKVMTRRLSPTGFLRYSMEAHFLFVTFAAAHLISLLRPKMSVLLSPGDFRDIDQLVRELVEVLRSAAQDDRHTPILYARYLLKQLNKFSPVSRPASVGMPITPQERIANGQATLPPLAGPSSPWPIDKVMYSNIPPSSGSELNGSAFANSATNGDNQGFQLSGFDLDFSLQYFMQTVNEPQFSKATPPPGESSDLWWQRMYPVNDQSLSEAYEWPMTIEGQASGAHSDVHRKRFSPELPQ